MKAIVDLDALIQELAHHEGEKFAMHLVNKLVQDGAMEMLGPTSLHVGTELHLRPADSDTRRLVEEIREAGGVRDDDPSST